MCRVRLITFSVCESEHVNESEAACSHICVLRETFISFLTQDILIQRRCSSHLHRNALCDVWMFIIQQGNS